MENNSMAAERVGVRDKPLKVLVVDDESLSRKVVINILNKEGHNVFKAENGQEGVAVFERERPDIVIMDIMMPVMDGYEATRIIKKQSGDSFVPVICLTDLQDKKALAKCVEVGADDFLSKPVHRVILNAKIDAMLRIKRLYNTVTEQNEKLADQFALLEHEQEIAENVFSNILSAIPSDSDSVHFSLTPMGKVGGDLVLSTPVFIDRQYVFLGDFTGHGLSAAIGAVPVAEVFNEIKDNSHSIGDVARKTNNKLKALLPSGFFLCACLIEVDYSDNKIHVWLGGLPDLLIYDRNRRIKKRVASKHLPMGILGDKEFDQSLDVISVDVGDQIFFYSDGITEAENKDGEMFGQERLEDLIANSQNPDFVIDEIKKNLDIFCEGVEQSDDITIAVIEYRKIEDKDTV